MPWEPDYVTKEDLKLWRRETGTIDDTQLALAVTSASRAVDGTTYRQFGQVAAPESRQYTPKWSDKLCRWVVYVDDLMDSAGLTVTVAAGAITLYTLRPFNAAQKARPWTRLVIDPASTIKPKGEVGEVTVTGKWGWLAVPDTVKQATLLQASRLAKRREAPFGIAGSPDQGSEMRLLARVDPDVAVTLQTYVRKDAITRRAG